MSPPSTRGINTRQEIIRAAHDLFIRKGYHGTSMRTIASDAGIALGGIYNHFDSKEDIFREVLFAYHPYTEILPAIANTRFENIEDLVRNAARMIDETLSERPDLINLMFIEIVEFGSRNLPELLRRILPEISTILVRFNEAGGSLRPIPVPILMRTFMGVLLGYFLTKNALGADPPVEFRQNALDHFIDIYLHGIIKLELQP